MKEDLLYMMENWTKVKIKLSLKENIRWQINQYTLEDQQTQTNQK